MKERIAKLAGGASLFALGITGVGCEDSSNTDIPFQETSSPTPQEIPTSSGVNIDEILQRTEELKEKNIGLVVVTLTGLGAKHDVRLKLISVDAPESERTLDDNDTVIVNPAFTDKNGENLSLLVATDCREGKYQILISLDGGETSSVLSLAREDESYSDILIINPDTCVAAIDISIPDVASQSVTL